MIAVSLANSVRSRPLLSFVCSLLIILLIAQADYITGYEFSISLLYLVPVCLAAWTGGRPFAWIVAALATAAWFATDVLAGHIYSHAFYRYWEAAIHLATYAIFAEVLMRLKSVLARADERFVMALEGMEAAVCVGDMVSGELLFTNGRFRSDFGTVLPRNSIDSLRSILGRTPATSREHATSEFEGAHGERMYLVRERTIRWTNARPVLLVTLTDITAHKSAERTSRVQQEEMERTSKLVAVGEIASMLAHEMGQPLTAIVNYNRGCIRRLRSGDAKAEELLDIMQQSTLQAERAANIIQRARDFLRKREPTREPVYLQALVAHASVLLREDLTRTGVKLSIEVHEPLPVVHADRSMIEQVVVNLVRNAIDAMQQTAPEQREIGVALSCAGDAVTVSVRDRGCGIPDEIARDLFKPFFSTKAEGMGLGLSICRSIIEYHHGRLVGSRHAEGGSTFQFTLPLSALP